MIINASKLAGVHEWLAATVRVAAERMPIAVLEGLRTSARQAELVKAGASRTLQSKHLTGNAVDLGVIVGGDVRWDWPLYFRLAEAMQAAAMETRRPNIDLRWGGCWSSILVPYSPEELQAAYVQRCASNGRKPFLDGPHFEVSDADISA